LGPAIGGAGVGRMSSCPLDQLPLGDWGVIVDIRGDDVLARRLMEMGLTIGERVQPIGRAPLGDPIELLIRGYHLSLRGSEAARVLVEPTT
jgi:Fe2+ transport system protein FeoA